MNKKVIDISSPSKIEKEKERRKSEDISGLKIFERQEKKSSFKIKKSFIIFLLFLILFGGICFFVLPKAEIEIWPETKILSLETKLKVDKNKEGIDFTEKIIPAQVFEKEKTLVESFQSSGKVLKEEKAKGAIKIYNEHSTSPQVLVATTRFVSTDGKVFRTPVSVTVPGGTYQEGKFVPGEIDVEVIADEPGPEYNIGPSTFSIPGFAGTDRYTKFYGKSFQPMKGGLKEEVFKVTENDIIQAEELLTNKAKKECEEFLKSELQSEEIISSFYYLEEIKTKVAEKISLSVVGEEAKEFNFRAKAVCETLIFKKEDLKKIATELIGDLLKEEEKIYEESLKLNYFPDTINLENGFIILYFDFSVKAYSEVDIDGLKNALAGKSSLESKLFLENQAKIEKISVKFWPFWVNKVPKNFDKIKIDITIDPIIQ